MELILQYDLDSVQEWTPHFILRDHPYSVGCLAWSKDDSTLLTSAENHIKLWNTKVNHQVYGFPGRLTFLCI